MSRFSEYIAFIKDLGRTNGSDKEVSYNWVDLPDHGIMLGKTDGSDWKEDTTGICSRTIDFGLGFLKIVEKKDIIDEKPNSKNLSSKNLTSTDDLIRLLQFGRNPPYCDEKTAVHFLRWRFLCGNFYTYLGDKCTVFINPHDPKRSISKDLFKIEAHQERVKTAASKTGSSSISINLTNSQAASISTIAMKILENITVHSKQAIILLGESGSGKTTVFRELLGSLKNIAVQPAFDKKLRASISVLDSFTNCRTPLNNDSTRANKIYELFVEKGRRKVHGVRVNVIGLETPRTTSPNKNLEKNERNFHIFYQMCASRSHFPDLPLEDPNNFYYLRSIPVENDVHNDKRGFLDLLSNMRDLRIESYELQQLFALCSFVLCMGNLTFSDDNSSDDMKSNSIISKQQVSSEATKKKRSHSIGIGYEKNISNKDLIANYGPLKRPEKLPLPSFALPKEHSKLLRISSMLGMSYEEFIDSFSSVSKVISGKAMKIFLSPQEADVARHKFAEFLYSRIVNWLVERINKSLQSSDSPDDSDSNRASIVILDFCGFEDLSKNSLQQMFTNFNNEKLYQLAIVSMIKIRENNLKSDGVVLPLSKFRDNLNTIEDMVAQFSALDNEARRLGKSEEGSELTHIKDMQKRKSQTQFIVKHFVKDVTYEVSHIGLVEAEDKHIFDIFSSIKIPLAQLMIPRKRDQYSRSPTVSLRRQVELALENIKECETNFVMCLKSNKESLPNSFESGFVHRSIKSHGVFDICTSNFELPNNQEVFKAFLARLRRLFYTDMRDMEVLSGKLKRKYSESETVRNFIERIAEIHDDYSKISNCIVGHKHVYWGAAIESLFQIRHDAVETKAGFIIQSAFLRFVARTKLFKLKALKSYVNKGLKTKDGALLKHYLKKAEEIDFDHVETKELQRVVKANDFKENFSDEIKILAKKQFWEVKSAHDFEAAVSLAKQLGILDSETEKKLDQIKNAVVTFSRMVDSMKNLINEADPPLGRLENVVDSIKITLGRHNVDPLKEVDGYIDALGLISHLQTELMLVGKLLNAISTYRVFNKEMTEAKMFSYADLKILSKSIENLESHGLKRKTSLETATFANLVLGLRREFINDFTQATTLNYISVQNFDETQGWKVTPDMTWRNTYVKNEELKSYIKTNQKTDYNTQEGTIAVVIEDIELCENIMEAHEEHIKELQKRLLGRKIIDTEMLKSKIYELQEIPHENYLHFLLSSEIGTAKEIVRENQELETVLDLIAKAIKNETLGFLREIPEDPSDISIFELEDAVQLSVRISKMEMRLAQRDKINEGKFVLELRKACLKLIQSYLDCSAGPYIDDAFHAALTDCAVLKDFVVKGQSLVQFCTLEDETLNDIGVASELVANFHVGDRILRHLSKCMDEYDSEGIKNVLLKAGSDSKFNEYISGFSEGRALLDAGRKLYARIKEIEKALDKGITETHEDSLKLGLSLAHEIGYEGASLEQARALCEKIITLKTEIYKEKWSIDRDNCIKPLLERAIKLNYSSNETDDLRLMVDLPYEKFVEKLHSMAILQNNFRAAVETKMELSNIRSSTSHRKTYKKYTFANVPVLKTPQKFALRSFGDPIPDFQARKVMEGMLYFSNAPLPSSMTILDDEHLESIAIKQFQLIRSYMNCRKLDLTIRFPKMTALAILENARSDEKLASETYCQLMKQSSYSSNDEYKEKAWELIEICAKNFVAANSINIYIEAFFRDRNRKDLLKEFYKTMITSSINPEKLSLVLRSGWLRKIKSVKAEESASHASKRRYFFLSEKSLYYMDSEDTKFEILGVINVTSIADIQSLMWEDNEKLSHFPFSVTAKSGRQLHLSASSFQERKCWVAFIDEVRGYVNMTREDQEYQQDFAGRLTLKTTDRSSSSEEVMYRRDTETSNPSSYSSSFSTRKGLSSAGGNTRWSDETTIDRVTSSYRS